MHILMIDFNEDYEVPDLHGPFDTVEEAQAYARAFRESNEIPGHENVEPTSAENEAWTEAGWYFGIFEPYMLPEIAELARPAWMKAARERQAREQLESITANVEPLLSGGPITDDEDPRLEGCFKAMLQLRRLRRDMREHGLATDELEALDKRVRAKVEG